MKIWVLLFLLTLSSGVDGNSETVPNFHQVNPWLYRGARPRQEGILYLKQMGIETIVNLEAELLEQEPGEVKKERDWAKEAGIRFEHIPMHPICTPEKKDIEKVLALITDPLNHPVFVHCDRGSDRTGIVIAAYRIKYEGWTVQQAFEEMKKYGHRSIILFWWKNLLYKFKEV